MNRVLAAKEGGSYQFESDFGFFEIVASTGGVQKHGNDVLKPADIEWHTGDTGSGRSADVAIEIAAMGTVFAKQPLHSSVAVCHLKSDTAPGEDQAHPVVTLAGLVPEKTKRLRLILRDMSNGRMGTVDVPLATIAKAPEFDPVIPQLSKRPSVSSR